MLNGSRCIRALGEETTTFPPRLLFIRIVLHKIGISMLQGFQHGILFLLCTIQIHHRHHIAERIVYLFFFFNELVNDVQV